MTNVDENRKIRPVLSDHELDLMIEKVKVNSCEFLSLRNPAILCVLRLTGKRREEVAGLKRRDVWIENQYLAMNFKLLKKKRRRISDNGTIIPGGIPPEKVRYVPLRDPLVEPIISYLEYLNQEYPESSQFWLQVRSVFGIPIVYPDRGISGRQIYNVVRGAGDSTGVVVWPHLFRETAGGEEARQNPDLTGILKVMQRIDVTERTAWRYMDRYVTSIIDREGVSNA